MGHNRISQRWPPTTVETSEHAHRPAEQMPHKQPGQEGEEDPAGDGCGRGSAAAERCYLHVSKHGLAVDPVDLVVSLAVGRRDRNRHMQPGVRSHRLALHTVIILRAEHNPCPTQ